jgi:hypothetical protein
MPGLCLRFSQGRLGVAQLSHQQVAGVTFFCERCLGSSDAVDRSACRSLAAMFNDRTVPTATARPWA